MKHLKTFLLTLALFAASISVAYAENPAQLKTTIETFAHGGTGTLSATVSGNTVTVTGNVTGVTKELYLNIDAGVTVLWKAEYLGSSTNLNIIIVLGGKGTFEVAGGSIIQNGNNVVIRTDNDGITIKVSGGRVVQSITGLSSTIYNPFSTGVIEISGGTVQASNNGDAIWGATINITGGSILAREGYAVRTGRTGRVNINGGILFAYGTSATDVVYDEGDGSNIHVSLSGNAVITAWNKEAGRQDYDKGTNTDIYSFPANTAVWDSQNEWGFAVNNNGNAGFIPVETRDFPVCKIGKTGYYSITDAIAAVPPGGATPTVIKLLKNITHNNFTSYYRISNKKITFDLNGFDLIFTGGCLALDFGSVINYTGTGEFKVIRNLTDGSVAYPFALRIEGDSNSCTLTGVEIADNRTGTNLLVGAIYVYLANRFEYAPTVVVNGDVKAISNGKTGSSARGMHCEGYSNITVKGNIISDDCGRIYKFIKCKGNG